MAKKHASTRYVESREGYQPVRTPSIPRSMNGPQIRPIAPVSTGLPAPAAPGPPVSQS